MQETWQEIQSLVLNSNLYTTNLARNSISSSNSNLYTTNVARNSICSNKFKFIYDKIGKKCKERIICFMGHTEEADSRSPCCGVLSFY